MQYKYGGHKIDVGKYSCVEGLAALVAVAKTAVLMQLKTSNREGQTVFNTWSVFA